MMMDKYYVYKFSKGDEALYIGRTNNLDNRLNQHSGSAHFYESDKQEFIEFNNKFDHMIAEMFLINKFKPKYNAEFNYDDSKTELHIDLPEFKPITEHDRKHLKSNTELNLLRRNKQIEVENIVFPEYGFERSSGKWIEGSSERYFVQPGEGTRLYLNGKVEIETLGSSIKRYMIYVDLMDEDTESDEFYAESKTPEDAIEIVFNNGLDKYFKEAVK